MKKAGERFEPGVHYGSPNVCGEDAITVVERSVDGIGSPLVGSACKAEGLWEHISDLLPIEAPAGPFQSHQPRADFIRCGALSRKSGTSQPPQGARAVFERTPPFSVTAFREITE